jgi:hypothetical protein
MDAALPVVLECHGNACSGPKVVELGRSLCDALGTQSPCLLGTS